MRPANLKEFLMEKYIVITSINPPNENIQAFIRSKYTLIVSGDTKTPVKQYNELEGCTYLVYSVDGSNRSPINHYARKNIGYAYAINNGADIIAESDDDNMPMSNWGSGIEEEFNNNYHDVLITDKKFHNMYAEFYFDTNRDIIWPRGFPLSEITNHSASKITPRSAKIGIVQDLIEGTPDVDALHRLVFGMQLYYTTTSNRQTLALCNTSYCPFNSQNTFWRKELFPLMYLPYNVSQRYSDILRGYVAQRIMREFGYSVLYRKASVIHDRNKHDLFEDFKEEISMYTTVPAVVECLDKIDMTGLSMEAALVKAYRVLTRHNIICASESQYLNLWLYSISGEL